MRQESIFPDNYISKRWILGAGERKSRLHDWQEALKKDFYKGISEGQR
jgi:hypothetical protein